jgi:hypothetical protein
VLWKQDGLVMYRVPLREYTLAHVVPEGAIVPRTRGSRDGRDVERYVAALGDPSLPGATFEWEGRNRIRIRTAPGPGRVVTVQESYHPGWHAAAGGRKREVQRDGLGLMWLRPGCDGPCEVVLDYDGGWELRACRWLSWAAIAGLLAFPLWAAARRFRTRSPHS